MEFELKINKVKKENGTEMDVNWTLDLDNLKIKPSNIEYETLLTLFEMKHPFDEMKPQNLVLFSNDKYFYCHNCIFGYNMSNGIFTVFANTIDYIISNTMNKFEDLKCDKYQICFELPKCIRNNYIAYNISFKYNNSTKVLLEKKYKSKCPCQLILTIKKDKKTCVKKLPDLALTIYEILMIYFGVGLKIISRSFYLDDQKMNFYALIVDKYNHGVKNSISFSNFIMLDNNSLNKEIIQKYNILKKETLILCDVYFTIINTDTYRCKCQYFNVQKWEFKYVQKWE